MGRHLNTERWYDIMPATGKLRLKRVSAEKERQFPKHYRILLRDTNASTLTKAIMDAENLSLGQAWDHVRKMVNS